MGIELLDRKAVHFLEWAGCSEEEELVIEMNVLELINGAVSPSSPGGSGSSSSRPMLGEGESIEHVSTFVSLFLFNLYLLKNI